MQTVKLILVILVISCMVMSCNKDGDGSGLVVPDEELIFGTYYGECFGEECVETFKLAAGALYEDREDNYRGGPFDFEQLSIEQYDLAKNLFDSFPSELLDETDEIFGCPDCGDWGGFYVEWIDKDGVSKGWNIDRVKDDIPNYLHDFIDEIDNTITLINR